MTTKRLIRLEQRISAEAKILLRPNEHPRKHFQSMHNYVHLQHKYERLTGKTYNILPEREEYRRMD